ncbi:MAG: Gfo/Idh/MocA family oxidoreductase [Planctomycetota bacterium]
MTETQCRWGILSTANISRKNWKAIRLSGNGRVAGVASRAADSAERFIDECQAEVPFPERPEAYASYQSILESDQIDAVYIPLPTGLRKEWVIKAANAKKHVLIEKPLADSVDDALEMVQACRSNGVQMMDGVMFDHSDRVAAIQRQLADGAIGQVRRVQAHFSFAGDETFRNENIRTDPTLERHGCLGDLGWYCIRFILWANQFETPTHVSGRIVTPIHRPGAEEFVPGEFIGELVFASGATAGFFCSFFTENQQLAVVSGDKGYLSVEDYVLPFYDSKTNWKVHRNELEIDNCRWNFRPRVESFHSDEYHSGEANAPEVKMVRTFAEMAAGRENGERFAERSIQTQRILDGCLESALSDGALRSLK